MATRDSPQLPNGTQVIDPRGRIGEVTEHHGRDDYSVTYPDGATERWTGNSLHLQKQSQRDLLSLAPARNLLDMSGRGMLFRAITGSRSYGLDTDSSDTDIRGVFVCRPDDYLDLRWQLDPVNGVHPNAEEHYWELGRFVWLALKADPNTLECLWTPDFLYISPEGEHIIAARQTFLSRHAFTTYGGYVLSQLRRLRADVRNGEPNWKHAMHLVRLLLAGTRLLREGEMHLHVGDLRERLLAIKQGRITWDEYQAWRLALQADFDSALESSPLPERPDVDAALELVRDLRSRDVPGRRARAVTVTPSPDIDIPQRVIDAAHDIGERVIFATISGAHLYGFASADSDWDLRACHASPVDSFAGLMPDQPDERRVMARDGTFELDLVSSEVGKLATMLLKRNGYVLEQVLSPLIVVSGEEHEELVALARRCPTRRHAHHYLGFLAGQVAETERRGTVKALLYCIRVELTGIHLMRSGEVEANLPKLAATLRDDVARLGIDPEELIARKVSAGERGRLQPDEFDAWRPRLGALAGALEEARDRSTLPMEPPAALRRDLDAFVRAARHRSTDHAPGMRSS